MGHPVGRGEPGVFFSLTRVTIASRISEMNPTLLMNRTFTLIAAAICASSLSLLAATGAKDTRVFELRTYFAAPGKLDDLNARFRDHTMKLFEKHGIENIGYWVPVDNAENKLVYLIAHKSREAADASWKAFGGDPDWKKAAAESEKNGKLVNKVVRVYLSPTDYSAMTVASKGGAPRLFELREYQATPGKQGDLDARFRNHTCRIFEKHGMANIGYWNPLENQKSTEATLIYIVAHKDDAAAKKSWDGFRADPDWVAARIRMAAVRRRFVMAERIT